MQENKIEIEEKIKSWNGKLKAKPCKNTECNYYEEGKQLFAIAVFEGLPPIYLCIKQRFRRTKYHPCWNEREVIE